MGKVYSYLTRPIRSFNIENRTERLFRKEKPVRAPEYSATQRSREEVNKLMPDFLETHNKKDAQLHDHLKDVFVTSKEPIIKKMKAPEQKNVVVSKGKCTFEEVIQFLTLYQEDPVKHSVETISKNYSLDKKTVENIVNNFQILNKTSIDEFKKLQNSNLK